MRATLAWLVGLAIAAGLVIGYTRLHGRAMKRAAMYNARLYLERAYADYERTGTVPAAEQHAKVTPFTNTVVVTGMSHRCVLRLDWRALASEGFLAISTNGTVIWIDSNRPPRIIDDHYRVPLFSRGI